MARRAQSTVQDPDFQKMKQQFANDFDFSVQGSHKLHNLIVKFKKWIKILEAKTKLLPKSWLLEEKCRYLSNFSNQIVDHLLLLVDLISSMMMMMMLVMIVLLLHLDHEMLMPLMIVVAMMIDVLMI